MDWTRIAAILVVIAVSHGGASAQLTDADRAQLGAQLKASAAQLDPDRFPKLEPAKARVRQKMESLDRFLAERTTADNQQAWLAYLDVKPLAEALEAPGFTPALGREAIALRHRMIGAAPGLELSAMTSLRAAVEDLIDAVRFRDPERSTQAIGRQLELLTERIDGLGSYPSSQEMAAVGAIVSVLESSRQVPAVLTAMRNKFSRPNISILIGEATVGEAIRRDVQQTSPVRDCILGTRIVGSATLTGSVTANLLPGVGAARMQLVLSGNIHSNNTGYNGPVRLRTVGDGSVYATRIAHVNESGVRMEPVQVQGQLSTRICRIEHKLKLVRKIASRKAAERKPQADRIAVGRMRGRIGEGFAEQTDQATTFSTPNLLSELQPILDRLSLSEPTRLWGSTDDTLYIDTTLRERDQLSTVVGRPPVTVPFAAAVQLHESVINNACTPILAGRTLKESQLNRLLGEIGRAAEPANEDPNAEPEPPFEIDFARLQPVVFEARDGAIRIGVRGTRFAQGRREMKKAMEITASYVPQQSEDGRQVLIRQGEVEVDFPGNRPLTVAQAGLRPAIKKKFDKVFPKQLLDRKLEIPTTAKIASLRGRSFDPHHIDANRGWLTIAVR